VPGLCVEPPKQCIKNKHNDTSGEAHNKPELDTFRVVVGRLSDGGVVWFALLVLDDAHVVGVAGAEDYEGDVEDDQPVEF